MVIKHEYDEADVWRIDMARLFAKLAHHGQTRKYTGQPYSTHPIRVSKEANFLGLSVEYVQAAALHDVKEDAPQFFPLIQEEFGGEVADLVTWLTNPSKGSDLPRARRKEMDRNHLKIAPFRIRVIKALDRLDNLREMGEAAEDFRKIYAEESRLLARALSEVEAGSGPLVTRFHEIIQMILAEADKLEGR